MRRLLASLGLGLMLFVLSLLAVTTGAPQQAVAQSAPRLTLLNQAGERITTLTDGALVRFSVEVDAPVADQTTYSIHLERRANHLATCRIPAGATTCTTAAVGTLGWYWQEGEVMPERTVQVAVTVLARWVPLASMQVGVQPRPVVLVHGFGSDATTWNRYLGPSGFLALGGVRGYAVGDGQVPGMMHTGNLLNPSMRTNTIARNAEILGEYIANVKVLTGAEQVDLVVHSMGGLISRYYIDRIMQERDVAQLIMLGTPNGGSNCAVMIGSLGLYQPAGLELREDYIRNVFNPQITEQHDIPFYNFAGTPIQRRLLSPCSRVPNDLVVSLDSAASAPVLLAEVPILHTDLTGSEELFTAHVLPLLRKSSADFSAQSAQPTLRVTADEEPLQYSQVYTGFVSTPEGNTHVINIDNDVAVASFGLYDPSRTLTVTVRGASGNVIVLSPDTNGLTVIDDPESLLYLGYGFENPNPGPWQVTVQRTPRTPPLGAEYAIVAQYVGGASIEAELSNHLPGVGEEVELTASMLLGDEAIPVESAQVVLIRPDGVSELLQLTEAGNGIVVNFVPEQVGIYGIDMTMRAQLPDATVAERGTYLALETFRVAPERR
jgi:pimeloyl-ACP methyl ester carboxylesterase